MYFGLSLALSRFAYERYFDQVARRDICRSAALLALYSSKPGSEDVVARCESFAMLS